MKTRLIIFTMMLGLIFACSKDDGPAPDAKTEVQKSGAKEISGFAFRAATNEALTIDVLGTIDQQAKMINLTVPSATDVSALVPEIVISEKAVIDPNGMGNFDDLSSYTVTAEDGSKATYQVAVIIEPSNAKQILSFRFLAIEVDGVAVDISGEIDVKNKTINVTMPPGSDITALEPSLEISAEASIDPEGPEDFTDPVNYTISAGDGTTDTYSVVVSVQLSQKEILLLISVANPGNTIGWSEDKNLNEFERVVLDGNGKVTALHLFDVGIELLPQEIGQLSRLEFLNLGRNDLEALPKEIGQLSNLEELILRKNIFESLPKEIGQLSNLQTLDLGRNILESIPQEIGLLSNLKILNLQHNLLSTLPRTLANLKNLEKFYLTGNSDIKILHVDICDMDIEKGGTVEIDIIPSDEVKCVSDDLLGK